jgi:hypothetical protein
MISIIQNAPFSPQSPGNLDGLDLEMSDRLDDLSDKQLDHLCLGLTHMFGAEIYHDESKTIYTLEMEDGHKLGCSGGSLVENAWKMCETYENSI